MPSRFYRHKLLSVSIMGIEGIGDPRTEQLNPLAAATEFTRICEMLDERHMVSFSAGEDYRTSGKRIYAGNPTKRLHELLSQHYAGTPTARERLLTMGFIKHGYHMGDVVSDTPFSSWPRELGMDVENGNPGAFTNVGAREVERVGLLFWLPVGIYAELDAAIFYRVSYLDDEIREKIEAFLNQTREYTAVFGEPYDTPRDTDRDSTKEAVADAAEERVGLQRYLDTHPRP